MSRHDPTPIRGYAPPPAELLRWVAGRVHPRARVTAVASLRGGITAQMDRVSLDLPSGPVDTVLRRWPAEEEEADALVAREAAGLAAARECGVPVPRLIALDPNGTETGVPCTLTSALPGTPDLAPADAHSWLEQLAAAQVAIHGADTFPEVRWDGWYDAERPLDWLADAGLARAAREAATGPLATERVLVHGDYQHFNVLWDAGRLSGVVDWPNAATGNRGSDVGHCRLNLAVLFDAATAAQYLAAYERLAGQRVDRRADLRGLLCFSPDWQRFIPHQVGGRAPLDVPGMPGRVAAAVRAAVDGLG